MNINTKEYWDYRFGSEDWEKKGGRTQTTQFALSQISKFNIRNNYKGTILDFGCGLGDAIPVYHSKYPNAKLIGIDISNEAIKKCKKKYGSIASFQCGDHNTIPAGVDIIIASNVFEHLSDDLETAEKLIKKCQFLYIIVPYKERAFREPEHINSYDKKYFKNLGHYEWSVFASKGWSQYGMNLFFNIYFKNLFRPLFHKKRVKRKKQIIFKFFKKTHD